MAAFHDVQDGETLFFTISTKYKLYENINIQFSRICYWYACQSTSFGSYQDPRFVASGEALNCVYMSTVISEFRGLWVKNSVSSTVYDMWYL